MAKVRSSAAMSIDTLMGAKPNRIELAVSRVAEKLATLTEEKRASLQKSVAITFPEHFAFQQAQATAHAGGKLTLDEAQIVYLALGPSYEGDWPEGTTLAV